MTKRKLNIAEMICQAISIALLFLPGMYNWEKWEENLIGYSLKARIPFSFFQTAQNITIVLGIIIIALMVANLVLILLTIFEPSKFKNGKIHIILPLAVIILMILFSIICGVRDEYGYCAPISWLFYVEMLFLAASAVIAFMKCSPKVKEEPLKVKIVSKNKDGSADELKKYKELLDMGAITSEEYEAKKKEILGI